MNQLPDFSKTWPQPGQGCLSSVCASFRLSGMEHQALRCAAWRSLTASSVSLESAGVEQGGRIGVHSAMPRYFFHCNDGTGRLDADGVELRDLKQARGEVVVFVGERL